MIYDEKQYALVVIATFSKSFVPIQIFSATASTAHV